MNIVKRIILAAVACLSVFFLGTNAWAATPDPSPSVAVTDSPSATPSVAPSDPAPSPTPAVVDSPTPYPGGYTPGDTGNWTDIGPWFATVIAAAVTGPYAFMTFIRWIREVFGV